MSETYANNALNDPDAAALTAEQDAEYAKQQKAHVAVAKTAPEVAFKEAFKVVLDGNITTRQGCADANRKAFLAGLEKLMLEHSVEHVSIGIVRVVNADG